MICERCGQTNLENTEYCLYCGEKLSNNRSTIETLELNQSSPSIQIESPANTNDLNIKELSPVDESIKEEEVEAKQLKKVVNPVSTYKEEIVSEKINILKLILLTFGVLIRPGTTIVDKTKGYNKTKTGLFIYFVFSTLTFLVYIVTSAVKGCFIRTYNIATEKYTPTLDFGQLQYLNFTTLIIEAILISYGILLLIILLYYIASFLTNKGLSLGRYFAVITLSLSPFLVLTCAASPIISIYTPTFGNWLSIIGIAYSAIILLCTINDIIVFKNTNQKIIYHSIILLICFVIVYIIGSTFSIDLLRF